MNITKYSERKVLAEKGYSNVQRLSPVFYHRESIHGHIGKIEELMDNMFNKEFIEMLNPIGCLGMSPAIKEQHHNESARKLVFELLYDYSIRLMQKDFDRMVEKGVIPPSDTKIIATLFMFSVLVGNDIRIHEYAGTKPPIDCTEIYSNLKKFLTETLRIRDLNTKQTEQAARINVRLILSLRTTIGHYLIMSKA